MKSVDKRSRSVEINKKKNKIRKNTATDESPKFYFSSECSENVLCLTENDCRNLSWIWATVIHPDGSRNNPWISGIGPVWASIFHRIVLGTPALQTSLELENVEDFAKLSDNWKFRWHAQSFGRLLETAFWVLIQKEISMNDFKNYHTMVHKIGKRHAGNPTVAFDTGSWDLFKIAILRDLCPRKDLEIIESLNKLLTFVIDEMKWSFFNHSATLLKKKLN